MATATSPIAVWWIAARPRTLPAAAAPVLVGAALAHKSGVFAPAPVLAALAGALLLQIGANFANDYFDFLKGADTEARIGPMRVTQAGLVAPEAVRLAAGLAFAAAALVGAYLIAIGGWPIAALGVVSILAAIAYTGGPFPLGYRGLGEVTVIAFFGFAAVMGTYWVQAHAVTGLSAWLSVPPGCWAAAILAVNNLRDAPTDALCGKRTLAVRFGRPFARGLYASLMVGGLLVPAGLALTGQLGWGALAPIAAAPLAVGPFRAVFAEPDGPALNQALAATARFMLVASALLAVGLLV